jgi:hypothetical protein
MTEPPKGWGPILTIKVSRSGTLWAAWTDDVKGVLVHGHSLAEALEKFPAAFLPAASSYTLHSRFFTDRSEP